MCSLVFEIVRLAQHFQLEARATILIIRPFDPFRSQRTGHAHHIDNVPARITVAPLALIGIIKVAIEGIARYFIIKTDRVIPHTASSWTRQLPMNSGNKFALWQALALGDLRQ